MMNKVLTIVIPTYNVEAYIEKCLKSLVVDDERMKQLEVLVIIDGSKDRCSEIAHTFEEMWPQTFRVIDKENGNYGSCINRGLAEATGKYIKVLDADDHFDTAVFEKYIDFLTENDVDLVVSDFYEVNEHGKKTREWIFGLPTNTVLSLGDLPEKLIATIWHQGVTYKTINLLEIYYKQTEGISYTDNEWLFLPVMKTKKVMYFPYSMYIYLRGREGQTFDPKVLKRSLGQRVIVTRNMLDSYKKVEAECPEDVKRFLQIRLVSRIKLLYSMFLIDFPSADNTDAKSLDEYIHRNFVDIYTTLTLTNNRFGYNYIRAWRNNDYNTCALSLIFYRNWLKVRNVFK